MKRLFEDRITEAGRQAIQGLIDHVAKELNETVMTNGEDSREAAQCLLVLISIEQIMAPHEEAHARIRHYIAISEEIYGRHSIEAGNGFLLLAWSHMCLGRAEEGRLAVEQSCSLPGGKRDWPPVEPMLEALCQLLARLQDNPHSENVRYSFVLAVHALSWLVTMCPIQSPAFPKYLERIRPEFESWGFRNDAWEWLMRRCNRAYNDFAGLISALIEERMVPSGLREANNLDERDRDAGIVRGYEISGIRQEHWTSPVGFSNQFPIIVAEGELSMRVERLLAEGCRCLGTTGELGTVFLIFSDHFIGRRITAFGTTASLDEEEALFRNTVRETITALGADSAMMVTWVELLHDEPPESDDESPEAVMVMARDAKSYLRGFQPARLVEGKYVFEEPMVNVTENDWFSQFTFPVQPAAKKPRRRAAKNKPEKKARKAK